MMNAKIIALTILFSSMTTIAFSGDRPASRRAMSFLELGAGPRSYAMGEAFTGLADDITALSWNPAGLGQLTSPQVLFMHNQWIVNLRQEYLAGAYPLFDGMAAVQLSYLNSDIQLVRDEDGLLTGESFNPFSATAGLSYAYQLPFDILAGATLNYAHEQLDDMTYMSVCADLGVLYRPKEQWWSVGMSMLHAGLPVAGYPLPLTLRLGGAVSFFQDSLNATADVARTFPGWFRYSLGIEYWYKNLFALRAGYLWRPEFEGLDRLSGLRAGLGFNIQGYQVDYALVPQGNLGYGHRASLSYSFGGGRALANEKKALITEARKQGQSALLAKQYKKAINAFQKVLTFIPADSIASRGVLQATAELRKKEQQAEISSRMKKARRFANKGQMTDAIEEYKRVLLIDETNQKAKNALSRIQNIFNAKMIKKHLTAGRIAYKELRWADALLAWQSVLSINKEHQEAKKMLKKTRAQMAKAGKGFNDPRIREYYLSGLKAFERGNYPKAIKNWNKVLKIAPKHKQTKRVLTQAMRLLEEKINSLLSASTRYLKQNDLIRAAKNIRSVLALSSKHPKANKMLNTNTDAFKTLAKKLYIKGIEEYTQGQYKQAIANWEDVLTLQPNYTGAKDNIKKSNEKIKTLKKK